MSALAQFAVQELSTFSNFPSYFSKIYGLEFGTFSRDSLLGNRDTSQLRNPLTQNFPLDLYFFLTQLKLINQQLSNFLLLCWMLIATKRLNYHSTFSVSEEMATPRFALNLVPASYFTYTITNRLREGGNDNIYSEILDLHQQRREETIILYSSFIQVFV